MAIPANVQPQSVPSFPWWLLLIEGIVGVILGLFFLTVPAATTVTFVRVLGWFWLIGGILSLVTLFTGEVGGSRVWRLLESILGIIAGFLVLEHPLLAAITIPTILVIIMGIIGVLIGGVYAYEALTGAGWGAGILAAISLILGLILLSSPLLSAMALPFIFGVWLLVGGIAAIGGAFRLRRA
jgi:uncharacterized membrane protein HdeD (DUF308 family)